MNKTCIVALALLTVAVVHADTGGPDLFGYMWADEAEEADATDLADRRRACDTTDAEGLQTDVQLSSDG